MDNPLKNLARHVPLDEIAANIAGLGIPGLVLLLAVESTGMAGAAAVSAALVALGPGGMIGGAVTLVFAGLVVRAVAEYGFEVVYRAVIDDLIDQGESKESLLAKLEDYPLSAGLKAKVRGHLQELPERKAIEVDVVVEEVLDEKSA